MASLSDLLSQRKTQLKANADGTLVRTKDGQIYRERINQDGNVVRMAMKDSDEKYPQVFEPIEAAPDPEVSEVIAGFLYLGSQDAAVNVDELQRKNVKKILNVATGIENHYKEVSKGIKEKNYSPLNCIPSLYYCAIIEITGSCNS